MCEPADTSRQTTALQWSCMNHILHWNLERLSLAKVVEYTPCIPFLLHDGRGHGMMPTMSSLRRYTLYTSDPKWYHILDPESHISITKEKQVKEGG